MLFKLGNTNSSFPNLALWLEFKFSPLFDPVEDAAVDKERLDDGEKSFSHSFEIVGLWR